MLKETLKQGTSKGQMKPKADWLAVDSPKKRKDECVLFAFLLFPANHTNSSVHFLGESRARQSAFEIKRPLDTCS